MVLSPFYGERTLYKQPVDWDRSRPPYETPLVTTLGHLHTLTHFSISHARSKQRTRTPPNLDSGTKLPAFPLAETYVPVLPYLTSSITSPSLLFKAGRKHPAVAALLGDFLMAQQYGLLSTLSSLQQPPLDLLDTNRVEPLPVDPLETGDDVLGRPDPLAPFGGQAPL